MVTFNPVNAEHSSTYAYKCWYNYNYEKNTMGISEEDMQKINDQYKGKISEWKATAEKDNNSYVIDDDSFTTDSLNQAYNNKINEIDDKIGEKANTNSSGQSTIISAGLSGVASFTAAAPISLAIGVTYMATQPNKDEARALTELKEMMMEHQDQLAVAQDKLDELQEIILEKVENAYGTQEDGTETLEKKQKTYDVLLESYQEIMERVESGEAISEEDKALLESIGESIQLLGKEIQELQETIQTSIGDINDDIDSTEDIYGEKAADIEESLATTDYAASFDDTTKALTIAQIAIQSKNAVDGLAIGAWLTAAGSAPFCWWMLAFAAMGFTGAGLSTSAVVQQTHVLHDVNDEIDVRHGTLDVIEETAGVYENSYDIKDMAVNEVSDIEFVVPEELTGLEDFEIPDMSASSGEDVGGSSNPFASPSMTEPESPAVSTTTNNPFTPAASEEEKNPFA